MSERDERLQNAIDRIKNLDDSMKVNLKGKKYTMVAQRVQAFREAFGCGANISTEIVVCDDTKVIVKATGSHSNRVCRGVQGCWDGKQVQCIRELLYEFDWKSVSRMWFEWR